MCGSFCIHIGMCFYCSMRVYTCVRVFIGCVSVCRHSIVAWLLVSERVGARVSGEAGVRDRFLCNNHTLLDLILLRFMLCGYYRIWQASI